MKKPIDKIEFWNQRLLEAKEEGDLRSSVFKTTDWDNIDQAHKSVLYRHIKPSYNSSVLDAGCGYGRSAGLIQCRRYLGVDQVPAFIDEAHLQYHKRMTSTGHMEWKEKDIYFVTGDLYNLQFENNSFDWIVGISLMVMVITNLGWGKWDKMQKELLRVSRNGVLCLEYTDPEVYYLIRNN